MFEEFARGAQQRRPTRDVAPPDFLDPAALGERADDVGADRHAADMFDLAARHRLAIGNDGERLQQRARIALRALLEQPRHVLGVLFARLDAPAAADLAQLHAARGVFRG